MYMEIFAKIERVAREDGLPVANVQKYAKDHGYGIVKNGVWTLTHDELQELADIFTNGMTI